MKLSKYIKIPNLRFTTQELKPKKTKPRRKRASQRKK